MSYVPFYSAHVQAAVTTPSVTFDAHVQKQGWLPSYDNTLNSLKGAVFGGTTGQSLRLEAVKIRILNKPSSVKLSYRAHVQTYGWQPWVDEGEMAGTAGESKRMEAIELAVTGAEGYVVKYRAHVQNIGWQDWVVASKTESTSAPTVFAGTTGSKKRMEAIEIVFLTEADNDLIVQKENAIAQLKAKFSPTNHTIMKEEYDEAMAEAVKAINDAGTAQAVQKELADQLAKSSDSAFENVKDDGTIKQEIVAYKETQKTAIDTYMAQAKAVEVRGVKPTTNYAEYGSIKTAVENAKTAIENADTYKKEDIDAILAEQENAIFEEAKKVVKELVDSEYAEGLEAKGERDVVVEKSVYDTAVKSIDGSKLSKVPAATDLKTLVEIHSKLATAYRIDAKLRLKTALTGTSFKKAANGLEKETSSSDVGDKFELITGSMGTAKYNEIKTIKALFDEVEADVVDAEITYGDAVEMVEKAENDIFAALKGYMADIISRVTDNPGNDAKVVLNSSDLAKATNYNKYKDSTDIKDIEKLIKAYEEEIVAKFVKQGV